MTNLMKRIVMVLIGLLGGLCAWPLVELVVSNQAAFPGYFLYTALLGGTVGVLLGAFLASAEGLTDHSPAKAVSGAIQGALAGALGGILSALVAQSFLFGAGEDLLGAPGAALNPVLVVARAFGWAIVGASIGMGEGIRALSAKKIILGLIGGSLGGFLGGLAFTWLSAAMPRFPLGRLAALLLLGGLIAFLYSILERRFAAGNLKALNGPLKGKEFLVSQRKLRAGSNQRSDIGLRGYREVSGAHALFTAKKGSLSVSPVSGRVLVNDKAVDRVQELKLDDVIQLGSAKFLYGYFG